MRKPRCWSLWLRRSLPLDSPCCAAIFPFGKPDPGDLPGLATPRMTARDLRMQSQR